MIHGYHDSHDDSPKYTKLDRRGHLKVVDAPGALALEGWELEVGTNRSVHSREYISDEVDTLMGDLVTCERDGSLGSVQGFEIISRPATLDAMLSPEFKLDELCEMLGNLGATSHDTSCCGLHVHYNRGALGHTAEAQDMVCAKLLVLMGKFTSELKAFARRDWTYNTYCKRYGTDLTGEPSTKKLLGKFKPLKDTGDRYYCLNLTNANTIEFRIFRGTLKANTLKATLELCDTLVNYCKTHTTPEVQTCTWEGVLATCNRPELATYWAERRAKLA